MSRPDVFEVARATVPASLAMILLAACASTPEVPYPAFVQADELPDVFLASLPGIRAKQFTGNLQTRRSSNRLLLPAQWSGTTGASPSKSLELYVLQGDLQLGDMTLTEGGYAWLPAGWSGFELKTEGGAQLLYFVDDANARGVIRTPLISSSKLLDWQPRSSRPEDAGLSVKELRSDPGSNARTWLLRVAPQASIPWQKQPSVLEAYLLSGLYRGSECVGGQAVSAEYLPGGYFLRPAGAVHGGPQAKAVETSVWFLRTIGDTAPETVEGCGS